MQAGSKGYWFKMDENGELAGGVAKFVQGCKDELTERLGLTPNTLVVIAAGASATKLTGVLIKTFGANVEGHMDKERYEFCWIVDFPMYEIGDESGELEFCHNPFSMPAGGLDVPLTENRLTVDYAAERGWPLILVTCGRLGSINHTLLSLEAAKARGMPVAGVVHNWFDGADPLIDRDTPETTRRYLVRWGFPPVVVRVPRFDFAGPYPDVDFSEIFA